MVMFIKMITFKICSQLTFTNMTDIAVWATKARFPLPGRKRIVGCSYIHADRILGSGILRMKSNVRWGI